MSTQTESVSSVFEEAFENLRKTAESSVDSCPSAGAGRAVGKSALSEKMVDDASTSDILSPARYSARLSGAGTEESVKPGAR